jgi:molybdenum storage protein
VRKENPVTAYVPKDVPSALMRQTLLDRDLVRPVADKPVVRLLPWLTIVSVGGHAIIDRGRTAIAPVVAELRAALGTHRMLILTGAGIRARHVLGVGLDLGLPTGVLAGLASSEAEQNGHLIAALLAADGVSYIPHGTAAHQLASHLTAVPAVVSNAWPPFGLYELPPPVGKIPPHRSDAGAFLLADAYGAARLVFVKGGEGPHTGAARVERISAADLAARDATTIPVEPSVLDLLGRAKNVREFQVVNGLEAGNLTRALAGESVGMVVTAD